MNLAIQRTTMIFLGLFVISVIAVMAYQILVITPGKKCEANGGWWDPDTRICGHPIYLPNITGRPIKGGPAAPAKAAPN
jgi:hypothetical protein